MPPATPGSWTHTGYTQQITFGPGSLRQLTGLLRTLGLRRVLLVTTRAATTPTTATACARASGGRWRRRSPR